MDGKEARERQKAIGAGRGLLDGSYGGGSSIAPEIILAVVLGLFLAFALGSCEIKLKIETTSKNESK